MSNRPKRRVLIKSKTPIQLPRKWKNEEMETLLNCVMTYGHKNLSEISKHLPGRTTENIKTFIRTVHDTAGKQEEKSNALDDWIRLCDARGGTPWRDCIQIAQVLKFLSIDGLLENHPLPERCQGIDFRQAYRLVYQAMMGYPIQPVNKQTADFVSETIAELTSEMSKQTDVVKRVESFLKEKSTHMPDPVVREPETTAAKPDHLPVGKKQLKVYQRKRPASVEDSVKPSLKIFVEEIPGGSSSGLGSTKDFSVAVEGHTNVPTTVNVPMPYERTTNEDEAELLKSSSYNPFGMPEKWLREPLHVNVLQAL